MYACILNMNSLPVCASSYTTTNLCYSVRTEVAQAFGNSNMAEMCNKELLSNVPLEFFDFDDECDHCRRLVIRYR